MPRSALTTASTVMMATPAASASSSVPTATINVWFVDNGTNVNNYWMKQATVFDKANPGDTVNIEIAAVEQLLQRQDPGCARK